MKKLLILLVILVPSIASAQYRGGGGEYNPWSGHNGLTFEGNIGLGAEIFRTSANGVDYSDNQAAIGLDGGVGGFLTPQLALTARLASVSFSEDQHDGQGGSVTYSSLFIGPSLQYWATPQFWLGGGVGYAIAHQSYSNDNGVTGDSRNDPTGFALDLRAGFTFWKQFRNSMNVSVEYTPGFYKDSGVNYQLNGFQVAFGYQFL